MAPKPIPQPPKVHDGNPPPLVSPPLASGGTLRPPPKPKR